MQIAERGRRHAFDAWLRTGRWPTARTAEGIELKFNPNHDPETGRFTTADGDQRWSGGGFAGGGGGSGGGAGAPGGGWADKPKPSSYAPAKHSPAPPPATADTKPTGEGEQPTRHVVRNGYSYDIDSKDRTVRVSGELTVGDGGRSRAAQAPAGGTDRLSTGDGGHYIAARFNGPKEAFNHFAQDRSVNRGKYRRLEDQWERAKKAGHSVRVKLAPVFDTSLSRPSAIDIWFWIDGLQQSQYMPNSPGGSHHAK